MTDRELEKILQEEPDEAKVAAAIQKYRREHCSALEDKQAICDALCEALQLTRNQRDLKALVYNSLGPDNEMVSIVYENGGTSVNVSMDSGIAMIRDILRAIS